MMSIPAHTTTFGTGAQQPYERAARVWDDRIGSARMHAFHWRLVAMLALLAVLALVAGLLHVASQSQVKTYVVEIDDVGMPARITLADDHYRPNDAQVAYFLGQLVRLVRARSLDPVVIRNNWTTAYRFLADDAVATMNAYAAQDHGLADAVGKPLARTVEVSNILQRSRDSFQVRWTETTFVAGVPQAPAHYTGLFQVSLQPPRDEADVFHNPLGVYVVSFSWSREFNRRTAPPAPLTFSEETHDDSLD